MQIKKKFRQFKKRHFLKRISKVPFIFVFCFLINFIIFLQKPVLSDSVSGSVYVTADVVEPTQASIEIWFWRDTRTLPAPPVNQTNPLIARGDTVIRHSQYPDYLVLDFSAGLPANTCLPGKTSWDDKPDDGFLSKPGNVGFTAHCIGPRGRTFKISCGKLTNNAGSEIPYTIDYYPDPKDPSRKLTINCFGFTCRLDDVDNKPYIFGSDTSMQPHSLTGSSYTLSSSEGFGHDFSVYNCLYVPPGTKPGYYETNGNPGYEHLTVSWF